MVPVEIPDEVLFNDQETHNVYVRLARAHKLKGAKNGGRIRCTTPSRPSIPVSTSARQSPLSSRSVQHASNSGSPALAVKSYDIIDTAESWTLQQQALRERNGRALYEQIGTGGPGNRKLSEIIGGPHVDWCNPHKHDETPLMKACDYGNASAVEQLILCGATVNLKSSLGETALMHACSNGSRICVQLLVTNGADIYAKDARGWTAYSHALQSGCHQLVVMLQQMHKQREHHGHSVAVGKQSQTTSIDIEAVSLLSTPTAKDQTNIPHGSNKQANFHRKRSVHLNKRGLSSRSRKQHRRIHLQMTKRKHLKNHKQEVHAAYDVHDISIGTNPGQHKPSANASSRWRPPQRQFQAWDARTYFKPQNTLNVQELQQLQHQLNRVAAKAEQAQATIQSALDHVCPKHDKYSTPPKEEADQSSSFGIISQLQGLLKDVSLVDVATSPRDDIISDNYGQGLDSPSNNQSNQETKTENLSLQDHALENSTISQAFETIRPSRRDSLSQEQVVHYAAHFAETHDPHDHRLQGCLLYRTSSAIEAEQTWEKRYIRMDDSVQHLHMFKDQSMQQRCDSAVDLTQVCGLALEQHVDVLLESNVDCDGRAHGILSDSNSSLSTVFSVVINDNSRDGVTRLFFSTLSVLPRTRGSLPSSSSRVPSSSDSALLWIGRLGRMCQLAKDMKDRKLADLQKLERTAFEERRRAMIENVEKGVQARAVAWEIEREHAAWQADVSISTQVELSFLLQLAREKFNFVVNQFHSGAGDGLSSDGTGNINPVSAAHEENRAFDSNVVRTVDVQGATEVAKFVLLGWRPNGKDIGSMQRHRLLSQLKEHILGEMVAHAEHRARKHAEAAWVDEQVSGGKDTKIGKEDHRNAVRFTFLQLAGCLIFLYYGYKDDNNLIAREDKVVARAPPGNKRGTLTRRGSVIKKESINLGVKLKPRSKSMIEARSLIERGVGDKLKHTDIFDSRSSSKINETKLVKSESQTSQEQLVPGGVKAAVKWQSLWRARQARLQVVKEVQMRGTLLAMPGTIQGQSGWYERLNSRGVRLVTKYYVNTEGNWSMVEGPLEHAQWRYTTGI